MRISVVVSCNVDARFAAWEATEAKYKATAGDDLRNTTSTVAARFSVPILIYKVFLEEPFLVHCIYRIVFYMIGLCSSYPMP